MSPENGFDASKIAAAPSMERSVRNSLPEERKESVEQVANRVSRLKNWLHNSADVLGQTGNKVVASTFFAGKDLAINNYWMMAAPHDTATTILLGLATGAKLGSYATNALLEIQDELQDPQGRYIRELKRIRREFPPTELELASQRSQQIAVARQQYSQEKQQEEALNPKPDFWTNSSDISASDFHERRQELARQSELGRLERVLRTRDVPDLPAETNEPALNRVPDLFPVSEGEDKHE